MTATPDTLAARRRNVDRARRRAGKALPPYSPVELERRVEMLAANRGAPRHRPGSEPHLRQEGELSAFAMVLQLIETGSPE